MHYKKSIEDIAAEFKTDLAAGLSNSEAKKRLEDNGPNSLPEKPKSPLILNFIGQFKNLLVAILLAAAVVSLLVGDVLDALAIFTIVMLNASIGFIQEGKAEKTLESLKQKEILMTLVIRDGLIKKLPAAELVVGDLLILEEGQKIPADARVVEEFSLTADESILTHQSMSVSKNSLKLTAKLSLADWTNMVFKDTEIVAGRGKAIVTATGPET